MIIPNINFHLYYMPCFFYIPLIFYSLYERNKIIKLLKKYTYELFNDIIITNYEDFIQNWAADRHAPLLAEGARKLVKIFHCIPNWSDHLT